MRTLPVTSHRENVCLACREKPCCTYYAVAMTGRDVWRISQAMQISPLEYLRYFEANEAGDHRFLLAPDGPYHDLILAKRELPETLGSPCVFLLRTNDGHGVCGLGELRPAQCQSYPVFLREDVISLINDPEGCVRTWSYADIDQRERQQARNLVRESEEYRVVVEEWNRRVEQDSRERSFPDYCAYLLNRYASMEEVR